MNDVVLIDSLGHGGEGICRVEGAVVLVPGTLPGDRVRLGELEKRRGVLWARSSELVESGPHRARTGCAVFGECGGCTWLDFSYPAQGGWKRRIVEESFRRIARLDVTCEWREEPNLRLGYRTRATFHPAPNGWGFYARASHAVLPIESCPLSHARLNEVLSRLQQVQGSGDLTITVNPEGDDVLVWSERDQPELKSLFPGAQSEQSGGTRATFEFDGIPIVNGTFSQSSLLLNRMLREVIDGMLGMPKSLLDLYCGSGNFSLAYTATADVVGVDSSGPSVMAALRKSGADYRIGNESMMTQAIASREWEAVLLDPPRSGASKPVKAMQNARSARIVYVSCDPATLARDSRELTAAGWKLDRAVVVDMFPNTPHIECVCMFTR